MMSLYTDYIKGKIFGSDSSIKQYEKNITFIGTRGSSKTTAFGCLALTCQIESVINPNFTYFIDEKNSGICTVPADLCQGKFPKATPAVNKIFEADIIMSENKGWHNKKTVCLPFAETAGEHIEDLIGPHRKEMYGDGPPTYQDAGQLNRIISASQAYVLIAPVSRSTMPLPQDIGDKESNAIHSDPDLNIYRILEAIFKHKKEMRGAKKTEGIAVLLTKYDMVDAWVKQQGMSLYDPAGAKLFLNTYFRQTMGCLKNYGMSKVEFFPVHVQVEKIQLEDKSIRFKKWPDGSFKIMVDTKHNLPFYSQGSYRRLIRWLLDVIAK